jgi:glycosyltransferase involved in cell wall biosynthesis
VATSSSIETPNGASVLYITYDGLTDPLGRSQVLPYLTGLSRRGHRIDILSCEKPDRMAKEGALLGELVASAGIGWRPLTYHKRPPILSSALDAAALAREAIALHRQKQYDLVHCRSYIPARAGLALKRRFGVRFLFDMRGFWPDEKVEGGNWNLANPLYAAVYRYFKRLESQLLSGADHIVSLTEAGKDQLLTRPELLGRHTPITVIPCCVDFGHFQLATEDQRQAARSRLGLNSERPVLAYLGSLGSWYMLEEMLQFFQAYASRHKQARFLFVTHEDPEPIRATAIRLGVDPQKLIIRAASREEVPELMAAADLGIFFIKPVFSKLASSPTKMGEMLALGLPIVTNAGIGDVEMMVEDMACGVAIADFGDESFAGAIDVLQTLNGSGGDRRQRSLAWFDLNVGIDRYDAVYRSLMS